MNISHSNIYSNYNTQQKVNFRGKINFTDKQIVNKTKELAKKFFAGQSNC